MHCAAAGGRATARHAAASVCAESDSRLARPQAMECDTYAFTASISDTKPACYCWAEGRRAHAQGKINFYLASLTSSLTPCTAKAQRRIVTMRNRVYRRIFLHERKYLEHLGIIVEVCRRNYVLFPVPYPCWQYYMLPVQKRLQSEPSLCTIEEFECVFGFVDRIKYVTKRSFFPASG